MGPKAKAPAAASSSEASGVVIRLSPCGDQLIVSELFGAAPSREHIKRRPKKGELPPQCMFGKDTLTALHRGDVSGARHAVHRYVVLPQVPDAPLAAKFQAVCRS